MDGLVLGGIGLPHRLRAERNQRERRSTDVLVRRSYGGSQTCAIIDPPTTPGASEAHTQRRVNEYVNVLSPPGRPRLLLQLLLLRTRSKIQFKIQSSPTLDRRRRETDPQLPIRGPVPDDRPDDLPVLCRLNVER